MISRIKDFLQESRQEFKRVNWPSWQETVRLTAIVIVMSLVIALFLGIADFVFNYLLQQII